MAATSGQRNDAESTTRRRRRPRGQWRRRPWRRQRQGRCTTRRPLLTPASWLLRSLPTPWLTTLAATTGRRKGDNLALFLRQEDATLSSFGYRTPFLCYKREALLLLLPGGRATPSLRVEEAAPLSPRARSSPLLSLATRRRPAPCLLLIHEKAGSLFLQGQ